MKKRRIFSVIGLVLLLGVLCTSLVLSDKHWRDASISEVNIEIEFPDNQKLIDEGVVSALVDAFFEEHADSNVLKLNADLLETSLSALPYVHQAQVYWNMDQSLNVSLVAKQGKAIAISGNQKWLITHAGEVLPQPKGNWEDLPIITGVVDSATAAEAGQLMDRICGSVAFSETSLAQMHVEAEKCELVPRGMNHVVWAMKDARLEREMKKLAAYYAAATNEELEEIARIDLRYKNQVVSTKR